MDHWKVEERQFVVVQLVRQSFLYCIVRYVNRVVKTVCSRHIPNSAEENSPVEGMDTPSSQQDSSRQRRDSKNPKETEDSCYDLFRCEIFVVCI